MLQRGNQCYIKDETLGNKAYSALCLLAIELVSNNAMLRYFPFFSRFSFNEIHKDIFVSTFGYILPIKKRLVGTYLGYN